jgi:uncharacterized protein YdeI (BOF family)
MDKQGWSVGLWPGKTYQDSGYSPSPRLTFKGSPRHVRDIVAKAVLVSCLSSLGGCSSLIEEATAPSGASLSLPANPARAVPKTVQALKQDQPETGASVVLEGQILQRVPLLEGWLYELEDSTGRIWVLTGSSEPIVGESARVEGVLNYEQILVDGMDMGEYYLQERSYQPNTASE